MISVTIARSSAEAAGENVRPESANGAHDVSKRDVVAVPFIKSLFGSLGVTEVHYMAEALLHAVILVGLQQFQSTQDPEFIRAFSTELILAAFTASHRKKQRRNAIAPGLQSQQSAILIIGVSNHLHEPRGRLQLCQKLIKVNGSLVLGKRPGV